MDRKIVVGVHELDSSIAALEWALRRAEALEAPVLLVHSVPAAWLAEKYGYYNSIINDEQKLVRQIELRAAELAPTVAATGTLRTGSASHVLRELSDEAALIVVGSHRRHGGDGDFFGSVSLQIAAQSLCAVAVIPDLLPGDRSGVVVGVDGSQDALDAVEFAAAEAVRTGQDLTAVYAARIPTQRVLKHIPEEGVAERLDEERRVLAESVAGLAGRYPNLDVHQLFVTDATPAEALLQAAASAQLLVVGRHGHGGLRRLWMGSVSHEVLGNAPCPTIITHPKHK